MAEKFASVDEYIRSFPTTTQSALEDLRRTIRKVVPEAEEVISYNIPTYKLAGKYVVYFAGFKEHISVYPVPDADAKLEEKISEYRSGRGTLRFSLGKPLPLGLIEQVVKLLRKRRL